MAPRLPNFLIVGAMKSGTTSLARYLGAHPQVFVPAQKELWFFERDHLWERGPEWYAEWFTDAGDALAVGEASPNYMYFPEAVERIARTLDSPKLIVCVRDPVTRAYSHYLHWRENRAQERRSFPEAVADEIARGAPEGPDDLEGPYYGYLARGRYLPQLQRLADTFGRDSVHVVLLSDLESDPAGSFREVCDFLGIDATVTPENVGVRENAFHTFRPAWLWRFMIRHRVFDRMPKRVAKFVALRVMAPRNKPVPPMDPATRERLREFFAADNAALARWLKRDLSAWADG